MVIKPKLVIQSGSSYVYNEDNFCEYKRDNFIEVKTAEELMELFKDDKLLAMDTECKPFTGVSDRDIAPPHIRRWIGKGKQAVPVDIPFCISVGNGKVFATLYDLDHENKCPELQKLKPWLESGNIETIWHNAKFDQHMLANIGIHLKGRVHDTVLLTKLVNENRPAFTLRSVSKPYGGIEDFEFMVDLYKKTYKIQDYSKITRELMTQYANADIYNCWVTFQNEYPKLEEDDLKDLYENELIISRIAFDMERVGMHADSEYEHELYAMLQERKDRAEQEVYEMAGEIFNMNSGQQLHKILLKLGVAENSFKYSDKGNVKLDKEELARFADMGIEIVGKINECKNAEKLLTTYAKGIYSQASSSFDVHCSVNTGEATTGRMSVTKPARRAS